MFVATERRIGWNRAGGGVGRVCRPMTDGDTPGATGGVATESAGMASAKRAVAAYFAALRAMDGQALVAIFAEDALTFDPHTASPIQGHAELQTFFQALWAQFETLNIVEDAAFFAHDGAAVKWTTHGVLGSRRGVVFEGIDVFEVNERGTIQTLWTYRDPVPFLEPPTPDLTGNP